MKVIKAESELSKMVGVEWFVQSIKFKEKKDGKNFVILELPDDDDFLKNHLASTEFEVAEIQLTLFEKVAGYKEFKEYQEGKNE